MITDLFIFISWCNCVILSIIYILCAYKKLLRKNHFGEKDA